MAQTKKRPSRTRPAAGGTWIHDHVVDVLVVLLEAGRKDLAKGLADALGVDRAKLAAAARAERTTRMVH